MYGGDRDRGGRHKQQTLSSKNFGISALSLSFPRVATAPHKADTIRVHRKAKKTITCIALRVLMRERERRKERGRRAKRGQCTHAHTPLG